MSADSGHALSVQWVQVGEPGVHRQRGKWVIRQGGYDAATGKRRVKQLGTFESKRAAVLHQRAVLDGRAGSENESVGEFVDKVWLHAKEGRVEIATYDLRRRLRAWRGASTISLAGRSADQA